MINKRGGVKIATDFLSPPSLPTVLELRALRRVVAKAERTTLMVALADALAKAKSGAATKEVAKLRAELAAPEKWASHDKLGAPLCAFFALLRALVDVGDGRALAVHAHLLLPRAPRLESPLPPPPELPPGEALGVARYVVSQLKGPVGELVRVADEEIARGALQVRFGRRHLADPPAAYWRADGRLLTIGWALAPVAPTPSPRRSRTCRSTSRAALRPARRSRARS